MSETVDPYQLDAYSPHHLHWFGTPWPRPNMPAPVCSEERYHIDVPVGAVCVTGCGQLIDENDSGIRMAGCQYQHVECFLRATMCPWTMGILDTPHVHTDDRREEGRLILNFIREHPSW